MKNIEFLDSALDDLRSFPEDIMQDTGYQLHKVQMGDMPDDFKYIRAIGNGVIEIRLKDNNGIYRVIYTAKFIDTIYVLHAFTKKTQKTSQADINLAKSRLKALVQDLQNHEAQNQEPNHD